MEKRDIKELQQKLLIKEGVAQSTRNRNEMAIKQVESYINSFTPETIEKMRQVGIELEPLMNLDLQSYATNSDYRDRIMKSLIPLKEQISSFVERGLSSSEGKLQY